MTGTINNFMITFSFIRFATLLLPFVLTACASSSQTRPSAAYQDSAYGFYIAVPAGIELRHDFKRSYFSNASWKAFAPADSQGEPRIALVLPGSNMITRAELRIGVSAHPQEITRCTTLPSNTVTGSVDSHRLDGIEFIHFQANEGAMNHYFKVEGYRTVHAGRCYAIDLVIAGTNPQVYDPPATPPFSQREADQRLKALLQGFAFQKTGQDQTMDRDR